MERKSSDREVSIDSARARFSVQQHETQALIDQFGKMVLEIFIACDSAGICFVRYG
jgi:hypothetical protein